MVNYILVIVVAAVVAVVSSSPVLPCSDDTAVMSKCLSDNGLDLSDFNKYTQAASFDAEMYWCYLSYGVNETVRERDHAAWTTRGLYSSAQVVCYGEALKVICSQYPQYSKAFQCISSEFNRCSIGDIHLPSGDQISQSVSMLCNDSNIRFDCIAQTQQQSAQLQSCFDAQSGNTDAVTQTQEQTTCQDVKVSSQCLVDMVTKCDAHTGSVMAAMSKVTVSSFCDGSVVG